MGAGNLKVEDQAKIWDLFLHGIACDWVWEGREPKKGGKWLWIDLINCQIREIGSYCPKQCDVRNRPQRCTFVGGGDDSFGSASVLNEETDGADVGTIRQCFWSTPGHLRK
jgi:hypothetical protein